MPPCPPNALPLSVSALQITVVTSDVDGAGTDANVYLELYGQDGAGTGKLVLDKKGRACFQRHQSDVFLVRD